MQIANLIDQERANPGAAPQQDYRPPDLNVTYTRDQQRASMVRFDPLLGLAEVEKAAHAIGCNLVPDGRGNIVITRAASRSEMLTAALAAAHYGSARA